MLLTTISLLKGLVTLGGLARGLESQKIIMLEITLKFYVYDTHSIISSSRKFGSCSFAKF